VARYLDLLVQQAIRSILPASVVASARRAWNCSQPVFELTGGQKSSCMSTTIRAGTNGPSVPIAKGIVEGISEVASSRLDKVGR
jgi:hypothetical protein